MISSDDRIRNIAPSARECYFRDEKELRFYKKYTFINCRMECAILETEKLLGCIPWHLPKVLLFYDCSLCCSQGNGTKTCDPWAAKEFDAKMTEAQSKVSNLCPHCLPDCNQIVYSSSASSAKFRFETRFLGFLGTFPFLSRCDSRNLNLSPLCGVSSTTSPLKMQPIVEATYRDNDAGNQKHIKELISPMRKEYPSQSMISNEIIPALTQVHLIIFRSAKAFCPTDEVFV